ncbi:MAG: YceI family protein [Thermodesulfovibrionales bacterium]
MAHWVIDTDHSVVAFSIRHMMIAHVRGQFNHGGQRGHARAGSHASH